MTRKFVNRRTALDFKQTSPQLWKIHEEQIGNAKECVARVKHNIAIKYQCRAAVICDFFLFCHERQMIWKRRFGSSQTKRRPWTKDEIMRKYFFCNIYRELDGGTLYFQQHINNIIPSNKKHNQKTIEKVLWASLCYRLMNQEHTFKELKGIPDIDKYQKFESAIKKIKNDGGSCFTNAHQTMGFHRYFSLMHDLRRNKCKLLKSLSADIFDLSNDEEDSSLEEIFYTIKTLPNVGDFLAWQVTCDLLESDILPQCDENQFVQLGPGARTGLNMIFGKKVDSNLYLKLTTLLKDLQTTVFKCLHINFPYLTDLNNNDHLLTLKNIEHALCEYQKYVNLKLNSQKGRGRLYHYSAKNNKKYWQKESIQYECCDPVKSEPSDAFISDTQCTTGKKKTIVKRESFSYAKYHSPTNTRVRKNVSSIKKEHIIETKVQYKIKAENEMLPKGWKIIEKERKHGKTAGKTDLYWISPIEKKVIRSKKGLQAFLKLLKVHDNDEQTAYDLLRSK